MKTKFLITVMAAVILSSCSDNKQTTTTDAPKPLPAFEQANFQDLTPLSDGSAYAASDDSRLWYIRGNKAVLVTVFGDGSKTLPAFSDITPAVDGSAYGVPQLPETGLWHLRADHAEKVGEVASPADLGKPSEVSAKAFYALYVAERQKRKSLEDELSDQPDGQSSEDGDSP
jgi:hypothetical protein